MWYTALICPDELFWVEQRGAGRVGFDGYNCRAKGSTTLRQNENKPVGLAIDSDEKVMFWSNDQNAKPFDSWLSKVRWPLVRLRHCLQRSLSIHAMVERRGRCCVAVPLRATLHLILLHDFLEGDVVDSVGASPLFDG